MRERVGVWKGECYMYMYLNFEILSFGYNGFLTKLIIHYTVRLLCIRMLMYIMSRILRISRIAHVSRCRVCAV